MNLDEIYTWTPVAWDRPISECDRGHKWCLDEIGRPLSLSGMSYRGGEIKTIDWRPISSIPASRIEGGDWQFVHHHPSRIGGIYLFRHENDAVRFKLAIG